MSKDKITHDCNKCVHGYFADLDCSGYHNLCGAGHCYLCQEMFGGECPDFEEGKAPEGKEPM